MADLGTKPGGKGGRKMKQYVYRANRIRLLKDGVGMKDYFGRHPDAIKVHKPPCESTLERWHNDGGCKALDGCWVEPDGTCSHGLPSWLMALGRV